MATPHARGWSFGRIHAAGVLPCYADDRGVRVLVQVEDMQRRGEWVPAYGMFGGKVAEDDGSWLETCLREFREEVGQTELPGIVSCRLAESIAACEDQSAYVEPSKYQAVLMDRVDAEWLRLPDAYAAAFLGRISLGADGEPDWRRAATRLEWAPVSRQEGRWVVGDAVTPIKHELRGFMETPLFLEWFRKRV